jgi:hypothetical protein
MKSIIKCTLICLVIEVAIVLLSAVTGALIIPIRGIDEAVAVGTKVFCFMTILFNFIVIGFGAAHLSAYILDKLWKEDNHE